MEEDLLQPKCWVLLQTAPTLNPLVAAGMGSRTSGWKGPAYLLIQASSLRDEESETEQWIHCSGWNPKKTSELRSQNSWLPVPHAATLSDDYK